jgi:hypothetical protein
MKTTMLALLAGIAFTAPAMARDITQSPSQDVQEDIRQAQVNKLNAIVDAHKDDLRAVAMTLGMVDAAVICLERDAQWGETNRAVVLHTYDLFAGEIGLPKAAAYALRQDIETDARKFNLKFDCNKFKSNPAMLDELTTLLAGMR